MVSSAPAGSGLPIGLMPGALPSDHASRHTLNTTAIRLPSGHTHFTRPAMRSVLVLASSYQVLVVGQSKGTIRCPGVRGRAATRCRPATRAARQARAATSQDALRDAK